MNADHMPKIKVNNYSNKLIDLRKHTKRLACQLSNIYGLS